MRKTPVNPFLYSISYYWLSEMVYPEMSHGHRQQCPQHTDTEVTEEKCQLQWKLPEKRRQAQVDSESVYSMQKLSRQSYEDQKEKKFFDISIYALYNWSTCLG